MHSSCYQTLKTISENLGTWHMESLTIKGSGEKCQIKEIRIRNNEIVFVAESENGAYKEVNADETE